MIYLDKYCQTRTKDKWYSSKSKTLQIEHSAANKIQWMNHEASIEQVHEIILP